MPPIPIVALLDPFVRVLHTAFLAHGFPYRTAPWRSDSERASTERFEIPVHRYKEARSVRVACDGLTVGIPASEMAPPLRSAVDAVAAALHRGEHYLPELDEVLVRVCPDGADFVLAEDKRGSAGPKDDIRFDAVWRRSGGALEVAAVSVDVPVDPDELTGHARMALNAAPDGIWALLWARRAQATALSPQGFDQNRAQRLAVLIGNACVERLIPLPDRCFRAHLQKFSPDFRGAAP